VSALLGSVGTAAAQRETETVNRTVPFPDKGVLRLHNFSGSVRITTTTGRDVVIKAVRRAERSRLDTIKLDISTSGNAVVIEANQRDSTVRDRDGDNVVETEFDIQVPAAAELDIDVFSSRVTVTGVAGRQTLKTFSGDIEVVGARAPVDAKTFSARIEVDLIGAGATPDLSAETFSGSIRARVAESAKGGVRFDSFSGDFESDIPLVMRSSNGSRGRNRNRVTADLPAGSGGATLDFHTFSGSVRITK
jgi:Putative adhesin